MNVMNIFRIDHSFTRAMLASILINSIYLIKYDMKAFKAHHFRERKHIYLIIV